MRTPPLAPVIGMITPLDEDDDNGPPQFAKMPWYPRDFASSTRGWPMAARGAYRELLDAQWDLGYLPKDPAELKMLSGATAAEWRISWPLLEPKFVIGDDDKRRNMRLELHRRKSIKQYKGQSAGGKEGNRKRWGTTR